MAATNAKKIKPPKAGEALVRMYRQGLGDCFLLTFRGDGGEAVHVLIDCGAWDTDAATVARMKRCVEDIRAATDDHLNLLVCTHEHWDHNSGFNQQRAAFEAMTIDKVWLAWTENMKDPFARELKKEFEERRKKLALALNALAKSDPQLGARATALAEVGGSFAAANADAAGGGRPDPAGAMKWVRELRDKPDLEFLMPGDVRDIPGASKAARAFVLGPPHSRPFLNKNLPTKKQKEEGDVYHARHDAFGLRFANRLADDAFFAAVEQRDKTREAIARLFGEELDQYQLGLPFDVAHQTPEGDARGGFASAYFNPREDWRRIDNDWLNTAAHIALWMDKSTNNTSLVLAIELLPAGKVLLMTADAQVGNWLSWRDVKFKAPHDTVTADDLLDRTILYKVGHHGSHNATLRRDGLEKMNDAALVAMIPVNRKSVEAKGWAMPFPPMYRDLRKRTNGRVIRADEGVMKKLAATPPAVWKEFLLNVEGDEKTDVYFQYRCRPG